MKRDKVWYISVLDRKHLTHLLEEGLKLDRLQKYLESFEPVKLKFATPFVSHASSPYPQEVVKEWQCTLTLKEPLDLKDLSL